MKNKKNSKKGFTLIEILVVVLIIGILAAIALPQYQKAVVKSKASQLYTAVSSIQQAAQEYYLANGDYPSSFDQLDISYNWPKYSSSVCATWVKQNGVIRSDDFEIRLNHYTDVARGVSGVFATGPYKCTGFANFFYYGDAPQNTLSCFELVHENVRGSEKQRGDFCEKVMGQNLVTVVYNDAAFFK